MTRADLWRTTLRSLRKDHPHVPFPGTTVRMVDADVLADTVALTVTASSPTNLQNTVLFIGASGLYGA